MPIDPVFIALTALSFLFGRQRGPGPIRAANISDAGQVTFDVNQVVANRAPGFARDAQLLADRLTAHIQTGAPLPDEFYSGRQSTPYLRAIYNQVRADVIAARDDFVASQPPPDSETPVTESIPPDFFPLEFRPQFGGVQKSPVGEEDFFVPRFVRAAHRSIPGGSFGFAAQTPAGQRQLVGGLRTSSGVRRRPRRVAKTRMAGARPRSNGRKPRPGTKAWMSYIRGLRRKK